MDGKRHKSPKLRLSCTQAQLLTFLAEAGAEDLRCVVVNLNPHDLAAFEAEVMQLVRAGLVALYRDLGHEGLRYVALSQYELKDLASFRDLLESEVDPARFEGIMLTDAGYAAIEH